MTESLTIRLLDIWYQNDAMPVLEIDKPVWAPVHAAMTRALADRAFEEGAAPAGWWRQLPPHPPAKRRLVFGETS
jgi:hypothetical protein